MKDEKWETMMSLVAEVTGAYHEGRLEDAERLAEELLKYDSDILHNAALGVFGEEFAIRELEFLFARGYLAQVNLFDDFFATPLEYAALNNNHRIATFLLENGADVNIEHEIDQGNVLNKVMGFADADMVDLLLAAVADVDAPGWMWLTCVDKAGQEYENNASAENLRILQLLKARSLRPKPLS